MLPYEHPLHPALQSQWKAFQLVNYNAISRTQFYTRQNLCKVQRDKNCVCVCMCQGTVHVAVRDKIITSTGIEIYIYPRKNQF
jgi:hypothetical protein